MSQTPAGVAQLLSMSLNYKSGRPREYTLKMWGSGRHSKNTPRASRLRRTGEANCTRLQNHNQTNSGRTSMKSRGLPQATLTVQWATPLARLAPRPTTLRSVPTLWYGDARRGRAQDGQGGRKLKPPTLTTAPLPRPSKGAAQVVGTRIASVQIININEN